VNSQKSLEIIYGLIKKKYGEIRAKSTLKAIIGNVLDDLETEGISVSEENISLRLEKYVQDFTEASKTDVA
jgi:hypothetical protein